MKERKHEAPPRYDAAFKEGAIRLVTEEGRPMREMAEELGVCTDTIRNWLKASGIQPKETERQNRLERRQRDLEAENRALRKQLAQKDEVIEILKNPSAYFPDHRGQIQIHPVCICGSLCGSAMPTSGNLPQRLLRLASSGHQPQKTAGSATVSSTYYPASATAASGLDTLFHMIRRKMVCSRKRIYRLMRSCTSSPHANSHTSAPQTPGIPTLLHRIF